jgi:hypothetical protein
MNATAWKRPPTDILGSVVPIQQFLARTDRVIVALDHAVAFPQGCALNLHVVARRGSSDELAWRSLVQGAMRRDLELTGLDADLKFGVRFPEA